MTSARGLSASLFPLPLHSRSKWNFDMGGGSAETDDDIITESIGNSRLLHLHFSQSHSWPAFRLHLHTVEPVADKLLRLIFHLIRYENNLYVDRCKTHLTMLIGTQLLWLGNDTHNRLGKLVAHYPGSLSYIESTHRVTRLYQICC